MISAKFHHADHFRENSLETNLSLTADLLAFMKNRRYFFSVAYRLHLLFFLLPGLSFCVLLLLITLEEAGVALPPAIQSLYKSRSIPVLYWIASFFLFPFLISSVLAVIARLLPTKMNNTEKLPADTDAQWDLFLKNLKNARTPWSSTNAQNWFSVSCALLTFMVTLSFFCFSLVGSGGFFTKIIASVALGGGFHLIYVRIFGKLYILVTVLFLAPLFGNRRINNLLDELQAYAEQLSSGKYQGNQEADQ